MLATTRPDGSPHIVPITFAVHGRTLYTMIDHKPKKSMRLQRLENLQSNPKVSVLVDHYDADWNHLWWVRIDGVGSIVLAGTDYETGRGHLVAKYHAYRENPPQGPAIVISLDRVTSWEWKQ